MKPMNVLAFAAVLACSPAARAGAETALPSTYHGQIVKDGRSYDVKATFIPAPLLPAKAVVKEGTTTDEDGGVTGYVCNTTLGFDLGSVTVEVATEQFDEQDSVVSKKTVPLRYSLSASTARTAAKSCTQADAYRFAAHEHGEATVFGERFFDSKLFVMFLNKNHLETSGAFLQFVGNDAYALKSFDFEGLRQNSDTPDVVYYQFTDAPAGAPLEKTALVRHIVD